MIKLAYCLVVAVFAIQTCSYLVVLPLIGLVWYVWPTDTDPQRTWILTMADLNDSPRILNHVRKKLLSNFQKLF